ncbi:hypothetical protein ACFVVU_19205 [Kitasatospora sp. NPDC057965]|uniref:hypothetical protein n=1 Tax=Kitasatospora sp. NPDC057965 TaxID=3346291 RepID=UPI0036DA4934
MIVEDVRNEPVAVGRRLSAAVRSTAELPPVRLHFTVPGGAGDWLPERGDAFLAALLMPAMSLGEELVVDAPVSARLLRSARTVMEIYAAWWARLREVRLTVGEPVEAKRGEDGRGQDGTGLFFTLGVDSFYSLLRDRERRTEPAHRPVSELLFVNFEQHAGPEYEHLLDRVRLVAGHSGCRAVPVETNLRALTAPLVRWEEFHGAALAATALALQGLLGRCLIAAGFEYRHLPPYGSHPVLDHLWSTEALDVVHDGADATRTQKVARRLARSELALRHLTVCWRGRPGQNCGACEKCLRTMLTLELAGVLGRCATLPGVLDLERLSTVPMHSADAREAMREVALDARAGGRPDLAEAAELAADRHGPLPRAAVTR